jgi:hypothetical protein
MMVAPECWQPSLRSLMKTASLIEKLLTVERAVGHESPGTIRAMLLDLEDAVVHAERDLLAALLEIESLRKNAQPRPAHAPTSYCAGEPLAPRGARAEDAPGSPRDALAAFPHWQIAVVR